MDKAKKVLQTIFKKDNFLTGQEQILKMLFLNQNAAAIFPTGAGKSLCFQLPSLVLPGVVVVITPLIAIMKDQVDYLKSIGIKAEALSSLVASKAYSEALNKLVAGKLRIVYVAPERFANKAFVDIISKCRISLLAIDEAHCVSEWGFNFRPDYLRLAAIIKNIKAERTLVVTATAADRVVQDLKREFRIPPENVIKTGFYRKNLHLKAQLVSKDRKNEMLLQSLLDPSKPIGSTIIYVTFRRTAEEVCDFLRGRPEMVGRGVCFYHAKLERGTRAKIQKWFVESSMGIVVSTIAFGMGVNKPNIRYVYHYSLPASLEAYAQGIGRAGRDGEEATCELLSDVGSDVKDIERLIVRETPNLATIMKMLHDLLNLSKVNGDRRCTIKSFEGAQNWSISQTKLDTFLAQMEALGHMSLEPVGYYEKSVKFHESFNEENLAEIGTYLLENNLAAQLRELEHVQNMLTFLTYDGCQYQHMGRYFGDKFVTECGHCNYCVSKSSIEVRQLPVLGSKPAYERYKEAFGVAKSKKDQEGKVAEVESVEEVCTCVALGLKWTYKPQELKDLPPQTFGIAKEFEGRFVYSHLPDLATFKTTLESWPTPEYVYEALLGTTKRPFFARFSWDPKKGSLANVRTSFMNFLIAVMYETMRVQLDLTCVSMSKVTDSPTISKKENEEWLLQIDHDQIFANAMDLKKFYKALHTRICFPKTEEEKEWKTHLFMSMSDERTFVRLVPIYHLNVCEPIYIGARITTESVKEPDFETKLYGVYNDKKALFNVDNLPAVGSAPIGMVFGVSDG
eukprot:Phypoly_transcript_02821.p1 GENE.Phypoly_transcript_02821~~Phypoly_transcript_02821.p1  ORF type:complete len:863 (+),score=134.52 Phypoly_transcript_02821:211-2589(+)